MELTIDKRKLEINYRNGFKLSYWDLLFWQNKPMRVNKESDIATKLRVNLCIELQNLYNCANPENFTINSENNLELDRYFNGQLQSLRARGEEQSALNLEKNIEWEKARLARMFGEKQYEEYKHLVDFFKNSDYPASFQWLMLNETLKNTYRIDFSSGQSKLIVNERKSHQTILGMMNLPSQVLQFIYENASHYTNFKKLYLDAQLNFQKEIAKNGIIDIENVDTFGKGKWIKFNSEHSDLENFEQNVANLKTLVADTPWCTSTLASSHLSTGDFYVFVDFDNKAHIAVKMNGKTIDEVRGIKNGNNQELEEEYRDVAINFLQNNCDIEFGKEWLNKEEWNLRLVKYIKDIDNNNFQINDVPNLINDLFKKDYKSHGGNSNFKILKSKLDDIKPVFAKYYHCSEHEIFFGNYCATVKDSKCPYKVIIGDAKFEHCNDLGNLNIVLGSADFSNSQVVNLGSLQAISGDVDFCNSKITNLNHLQTIGGNAVFCESQVYDLGDLQSIGGNADFFESQVHDLGNLQTIGGNAYFTESPIVNLNKVKNIVGDADFFESQVYDLGDLQTIGGDAYFSECPIVNLGNLESIGGRAYFINSEVVNLGKLNIIGKDADFTYSKVKDLGNLQVIGGNVDFDSSQLEDLGNLKIICGVADFRDSIVCNLNNLQTIGRGAYFGKSQITNLGNLQTIGCHADFRNSQVSDLGNLKTIGGSAYFSESKVTKLKNLQMIGYDAYFNDSQVSDLGNLQTIGHEAFFNNSKIHNMGNLQTVGGKALFLNSKISDLGNTRIIGGCESFYVNKIERAENLENEK